MGDCKIITHMSVMNILRTPLLYINRDLEVYMCTMYVRDISLVK